MSWKESVTWHLITVAIQVVSIVHSVILLIVTSQIVLCIICFTQLDPAKTYIFLTLSRKPCLCLATFNLRITKVVLIRPAVGLVGLVQNLVRGGSICRHDVVWSYMMKKKWIVLFDRQESRLTQELFGNLQNVDDESLNEVLAQCLTNWKNIWASVKKVKAQRPTDNA